MAYFMFHNIRASRKRNWIQQSGGLAGDGLGPVRRKPLLLSPPPRPPPLPPPLLQAGALCLLGLSLRPCPTASPVCRS